MPFAEMVSKGLGLLSNSSHERRVILAAQGHRKTKVWRFKLNCL